MRLPRLLFTAGLGGVLFAGAATLCAQTALYVRYNKAYYLVRRVEDHDPFVDAGTGRLVRARSEDFALREVPEYAPVYVAIRHLKVTIHSLRFLESAENLNHRFEFRGEFDSSFNLKDVYAALEFTIPGGDSALFVQEIGDLRAGKPKSIRIIANLNQKLAGSRYKLHLYTTGAELFTTMMPFGEVEHALDKMVARRIANVVNAGPQPFIGPTPEYPDTLVRQKLKGDAVIAFTISKTGRVLQARVTSASKPEFGDAALTAIRQWRFLPEVKDGKPLATPAEMPFAFEPPTD